MFFVIFLFPVVHVGVVFTLSFSHQPLKVYPDKELVEYGTVNVKVGMLVDQFPVEPLFINL